MLKDICTISMKDGKYYCPVDKFVNDATGFLNGDVLVTYNDTKIASTYVCVNNKWIEN